MELLSKECMCSSYKCARQCHLVYSFSGNPIHCTLNPYRAAASLIRPLAFPLWFYFNTVSDKVGPRSHHIINPSQHLLHLYVDYTLSCACIPEGIAVN